MFKFTAPFSSTRIPDIERVARRLARFSGDAWRLDAQVAPTHSPAPQESESRTASKPVERARTLKTARRGFTLIELMVALALLMLMLAIIFVPLNLGVNLFHIGRARAQVQQASQATLGQLEQELRMAIHVYPNDAIPGITDKAPYNLNRPSSSTGPGFPYYQTNDPTPTTSTYNPPSTSTDVCGSSGTPVIKPIGNTSRIDLLLPRLQNGIVTTPVAPSYYLVTYYVRRLDATKEYSAVDNPLVLFRAQFPYKREANAPGQPFEVTSNVLNARTTNQRYPGPSNLSAECTSAQAKTSRELKWLTQNNLGEPNLQPLCENPSGSAPGPYTADTQSASHTLVTPRGMGLIAPLAASRTNRSFVPDSKFICQDTDGDGKVNRVTIDLLLAQFDEQGAATQNDVPVDQRVHFHQSIDLPNIR